MNVYLLQGLFFERDWKLSVRSNIFISQHFAYVCEDQILICWQTFEWRDLHKVLCSFFFLFPYWNATALYLQSSPALNVYHSANLDTSLAQAAQKFCEKEVCMYTEVNEIWLPGFFKWYLKDFGKQDIDVIK